MLKYLILLFVFVPSKLLSQEVLDYTFIDGKALTLLGKSHTAEAENYHRIDESVALTLPKRVQGLARNSAGLNLLFQTNSRSIKVAWSLDQYNTLPNMTPIAINGLDLYGWNGQSWQYVSSAKPTDTINTVVLIKNMDGNMRHYCIYLPLYASLKNIQIGIESDAEIKPADKAYMPSKKIVIYGSSITQGASASRPGMAYPSIIARSLKIETFNMGFSGAGKMEIEMADILANMDADVYVLDCVPNPSPEQIRNRASPFIKRLRSLKPNTPILLVESIFREHGHWDAKVKKRVLEQNEAFSQAYQQLLKEGYGKLYYISSKELLGEGHEDTVDGTHLSDTGQVKLADRIGKSIGQMLQIEKKTIGNY